MIRRLVSLLATAVMLFMGCSSVLVLGPSAAAAPPNDSVPGELQFTAKTLGGQDFSGESLLGKPVVLWFWAPWCPVCQREAPMVGAVQQANPAVLFVGVAAQDQASAMQKFVDTYPVKGFTHLADTDGAVWAKFGVTYQPAYAFINPDGGIDVAKASLSEAELTERVRALPAR
jgi:thiol-disulfide isomerase/thioredoxin